MAHNRMQPSSPESESTGGEGQLTARVAASRYRAGDVLESCYRLERPLGAGGAGVVWVARDLRHDVEVAVKILDSQDPDSAQRMGLEAQAAARLQHPAVVRVYRFGSTERDDPYLAMELLHGDTLADLLRRRQRIAATDAVRILLPVVDGLHAAHLAGIVHRDLKPDNIFIAHDERKNVQPKVLDFGSARLIRSSASLTDAHQAVGTPPYMSPEQVTAHHAIDHRTDIWSLCVMLYRAISGRRPFAASDHRALILAIAHDEPAPLGEVTDLALWSLIQRGLSKSPRERYSTMFELGHALAAWLDAHGIREDCSGLPLASNWLKPEGARLGFASAKPARPTAIGKDEMEAPHRMRYEAFIGKVPGEEPARPVESTRRPIEGSVSGSRLIDPRRRGIGRRRLLWLSLGLGLAVLLFGLLILASVRRSAHGRSTHPTPHSGK